MRTFASQGLTPQIVVISYPISSHLHHICASSYFRFLSQIFTSSLSSSGLHILKPHLVFTRSDLHRRVTLSFSYHLQDFIMPFLSQLYNLIYLRLQNFIPPLSGQPSSSVRRYARKNVRRYVRKRRKICQKKCQKKCQRICQKISENECEKICQKKCQKMFQKKCPLKKCQKIC